MNEAWKAIPAAPAYAVSNYGRIKRILPWKQRPNQPIGLRKTYRYKTGYAFVVLSHNGQQKTYRIHQLVAELFIGVRPVGFVINHKNCNKGDDCVKNLEYVTPKQNVLHAVLHRRHSYGEQRWSAKLSEKKVIQIIRWLKDGCSIACVAYRFNVSRRAIYNIVYGRNWKHVTKHGHPRDRTQSPVGRSDTNNTRPAPRWRS